MTPDFLKTVVLPLALIVIMFGMGMCLTPRDFARVVAAPRAKLTGLFCQILLLPVVAVLVALALRLPGEVALGLLLVACCPGGPTSNLFTHLARGDTALSVTLTAVTSVTAVFTIPVVLGWGSGWFAEGADWEPLHLPFLRTVGQLMVVTVVPIVAGMGVRRLWAGLAARMEKPMNKLSIAFLVLVIALAVWHEENLGEQLRLAGPAAVALNVAAMGLAFAVAGAMRLDRRQRITISIEGGIQNGTLALAIALGLLESPGLAMPAVAYSLFMFASGAFMIFFGRRHT